MFTLKDNLSLVTINTQYLAALSNVSPEVHYAPSGYENKPYLGILISANNIEYVIPLSSAKSKHKTWKNVNNEVYLIYEHTLLTNLSSTDIWSPLQNSNEVKHILAVLDIKKMIPVKSGLYTKTVLNPQANDSTELIKYKDLLNKEYSFCLKIIDKVIGKANALYTRQIKTGNVQRYCCDFKALEQVCNTYVAPHTS